MSDSLLDHAEYVVAYGSVQDDIVWYLVLLR